MRSRPSPTEALVTLPRLKDADERRARWRQAVAALGQDTRVEGPPPLDGLRSDQLIEAVRAALASGLVDDLDWISGGAAAVALYEITHALPASASERRELGRRIFTLMYGGNAETFAAVATRMALGSARQFEAATVRARVGLLFSLPIDSALNADPLALNLISHREQFERWVVEPSTGPLPARRLAATLLERAAREAMRRYHQGDAHPRDLLTSSLVGPTYQLLLADREPLVWRHAAVARGLLSTIEPTLREEIDLQLDPRLSPTEWRRAVVSLVACLVGDRDTTMQQCKSLLKSEIAKKHPGLAATMVWGLPPVVGAEPDAAEELLDEICQFPQRDIAEALVSLLDNVRNPGFAVRAVQAIRHKLESYGAAEPALAAVLKGVERGLDRDYHGDETIHEAIGRALAAYETTGAMAASQIAEEALARAHHAVDALNATTLPNAEAGLLRALPLLHDLDVSALEHSRLYDLLLLGRRPGDGSAAVPELERLYDRLGDFMLEDERRYVERSDLAGGDLLVRQRKLLMLLHLVDVETTKHIDPELSKRVRGRLCQMIEALLDRLSSSPPAAVHRILCATLARSLDAAVREQVADPADLLLLVLRQVSDPHSLTALVEASTNPDVRQALSAYSTFLSGSDVELSDEPESIVFSEADVAARLVKLSSDIGTNGSYRGEALRQVLLRLGRALQSIATARSLLEVVDEGGNNTVSDVEVMAGRLRLLLASAVRRVLRNTSTTDLDLIPDSSALSLLLEHAVGSRSHPDPTQVSVCTRELATGLPAPIARPLEIVLSRIVDLPMEAASRSVVNSLRTPGAALPDWLMPRRTIGGFYVARALGSGGVSSVFVARRIEERRDSGAETYALKVPQYDPNTARSVSEQEFMDMFREEAGALLALPKHPNLARFVTFDQEARPKPILVMELIRGQSLERRIRSRSLSMAQAIETLRGILLGLEAMHTAGVAHLDVKPSNVILRDEGTPVLVDFGLSGRHLRPGCGTLEYCAPEVLGVVPEDYVPSPTTTDMYAFGCLAFEVLCGETLFDGDDELTIIAEHVSHDGLPKKLALLAEQTEHRELCGLLSACLRRDPRQRPSAVQAHLGLTKCAAKLLGRDWPLANAPLPHISISAE